MDSDETRFESDRPTRPAVVRVPIHELVAQRWSPRAFDAARRVERHDLLALLEAARWAPSCYGDEPWRYLVWDRARDARRWARALDCLSENNQRWAGHAPLLLASLADGKFRRDDRPNRWGQHDTGAASENLCLQAVASGLMAHQMGGFDAERLRGRFQIPERYTCMAMIAVGYQADPATLPVDLQAGERAPRNRRPLQELCFEGDWEVPVALD